MQLLRKNYYRLKRLTYLLRKLATSLNGQIIFYTKPHPIYTDVLEGAGIPGYTFVYADLNTRLKMLEKLLLKKAKAVHTDASTFPAKITDKKFVVECEGQPYDWFFSDERVKHIFVESKWAAGRFINHSQLDLLYPSVNVPAKINHTVNKRSVTLTAVGHGGLIKGFDVVLEIYNALKTQYDIKLIIAGTFGTNYEFYPEISREANEKADFSALLKELSNDPNVKIGPAKRQTLFADIYPSSDIYLHFSRLETFGYSILEAMSYGVPVVATNLHAIPEMVVDDETGFLVNDFADDINSKEWFDKSYREGIKAVKRLIDDEELRRQMGAKAYERVKEVFNIESKKAKLKKVYDAL